MRLKTRERPLFFSITFYFLILTSYLVHPLVCVPFFRYYQLVRVFKNTWFARFADKEGISDGELKEAVNQLEAGQADADLGGDVYKMLTLNLRGFIAAH